eukprot:gnl/TRDRNA2_/TRDRNA2_177374_c5_seq3.p1 gnl/TRDRNA2_/TRDRNA2_177374_c5~~gnl/TRDRNA2_/TRDRNA2_177374_c5_seq3.p1  ORF type:complete len:201 (+),score=38.71 gnl/TRDRNA2_/TRDRNA2_177374_c5_seq3:68-604(+)
MSACEKCVQWQQALQLLRKMSHQGVDPDVIVFNYAIDACQKKQRWEEALGLLESMCTERISPNIRTYSSAITTCGKSSYWSEALCLLEHDMRQERISPDATTYEALVNACRKVHQWETAMALLERKKQMVLSQAQKKDCSMQVRAQYRELGQDCLDKIAWAAAVGCGVVGDSDGEISR